MANAFKRENAKQVFPWILDISTGCWRQSSWDPKKSKKRHDMIESNGAAVLEITSQKFDEHAIAGAAQRMWIDRRQSPVLSLRCKCVRRASAVGAQRQDGLKYPRIAAPSVASKREIMIKPDGHP